MYNQRYSKLAQINAQNVGKMQVAWMFSTGVLRGHEGSPLVVNGHDVRAHAVSQQGVRHRPGHAKDQMALRAEAGRRRDSPDVLRHRVSGPRVRGEQDLPAAGRQHAARARRRNRQGDLVREERGSESRCGQHQCAARLQGQGDHRHFRRRVGRARFPCRLRHQHGQAGLEGLQHRAGRRDADRSRQDDDVDGRRAQAGRQGLVAEDLARATSGRPAAARRGAGTATTRRSTCSITARAIRRRGIRRSVPATTSGR